MRISQSFSEIQTAVDSMATSAHKLENKEGISFKSKDGKSLPGLDVRFDWRIGQIKNIRVVGKTASGKSVDLEVVRKWSKNCV